MKMDWQRPTYLSGIFIIGFLLLLEWNEFSEKQQLKIDQQTSTATITTTAPEIDSVLAQPLIETTTANVDDELPLPVVSNTSNIPTEVVAKVDNKQRLIHISTDVLDLKIDKLGGDIVQVSLPKHKVKLGEQDPYILLNRTADTIYIAESGLIGTNGTDKSAKARPVFTSEYNEYTLSEGKDSLSVDLYLQQDGVNITKRFVFKRSDYLIHLEYLIDNPTGSPWQAGLYGQIKRDSHKPLSTADSGIGVTPYLGAATSMANSSHNELDNNYEKLSFDEIADKRIKFSKTGGWISMVQHYFVSAWIPNSDTKNNYSLRKLKNKDLYLLSFSTPQLVVAAREQGSLSADFYVGPKDVKRLEEISQYLDLTIDFGWLWWIAKPLFKLLLFIDQFIGNWGWSIIVLTLIIKLVFFYPSAISYRSMAKMRKLAPKMQRLKEQHGDDKQKMSQAMMKLYSTEKVNPMSGCLPILIQMPVFISLYWVLMESVELRHAPFMLWITDLSVKDPYFIFPIIMGVTMYIQQKLNPTPPDPMQAKIMQWMPFAFTFMFLWFPAGLVIYWVTNNTLSIMQQYYITRKIEAQG